LSTLEYLDEGIERVSGEIDQRLTADQEAIALLDMILGLGQRAAEILITEIGSDMRRFPSAKHLASWAGMCPGNHESEGKRLSGKRHAVAFKERVTYAPCLSHTLDTDDTELVKRSYPEWGKVGNTALQPLLYILYSLSTHFFLCACQSWP